MKLFTEHPEEAGMTYFQHMRFAAGLSFKFALLSIFCLTHSIFPFLFTTKTSTLVKEIHMTLKERSKCSECCCCKKDNCSCKHDKCCCKKK